MTEKTSTLYSVNEIFYSLQGEGMRTGTANVFVRFSGCNLRCDVEPGPLSPGGFACDTEFRSGRKMTAQEIADEAHRIGGDCDWIILTGGEPGIQMDHELCRTLSDAGFFLAVETNGTIDLTSLVKYLKWLTVSPKIAEHAIKQVIANEVKYVRGYGQPIPQTTIKAEYHLISPAFSGQIVDKETIEWCVGLVKDNPKWRLSIQMHKILAIR